MDKEKFHKVMQAAMFFFDDMEELEIMKNCGLAETELAKYIYKFVTTYK